VEELLWRTAFRVFALRLGAVATLLLALERRRIAHPKAGLHRFSKCDYSRDLHSAKWGLAVNLRGSNSKSADVRSGSKADIR
jgi:hypothetical protein